MRGTKRPYFLEQIPLAIKVKTLFCTDVFFHAIVPCYPGYPREIFWFKTPADSPAPPKVFSLLTPRLYLAGNQKPRTTTALDTTRRTRQLPDKITVLKPRGPRHFRGPRVAGATNDWCITCFKPDFSLHLNNVRYTSFQPFIYVYIVTRKRSIWIRYT